MNDLRLIWRDDGGCRIVDLVDNDSLSLDREQVLWLRHLLNVSDAASVVGVPPNGPLFIASNAKPDGNGNFIHCGR